MIFFIYYLKLFRYTPSSMKIGEFRCWIFSYIEAKFSSIAALWFKILTKIGGTKTYIKIRVSCWMEYKTLDKPITQVVHLQFFRFDRKLFWI